MIWLESDVMAAGIAAKNPGTAVLDYGEAEGENRYGLTKDLGEVMFAILILKATPIYYYGTMGEVQPQPALDPASDIASTDK